MDREHTTAPPTQARDAQAVGSDVLRAKGKRDRSLTGTLWQLLKRLRGLSRPELVVLALFGLIALTFLLSLNLGFIRIAPLDVIRTFVGQGTPQQELVLFQFRMPRLVLALLVGMGLALSGAILQGVSQNGLADPGILGINAGAGLGVVALLLFYSSPGAASPFILPVTALVGGIAAAALIYMLAYKDGAVTPSRLLLVGIAVNAGIAAAMLVLSMRMDRQLYSYAVVWLSGTIAGKDWKSVLALLPWTLVLVPLVMVKARLLNVLSLGDQLATGLGAAVERARLILIGVAVALAASAVAVSGGIGFVGLVAPHLARRLVGPNHRVMLPVTLLSGALLVLVADTLARNLLSPVELPVGLVVSAIGAPYFLYLLARTKG
jgi:iron complex transport system permease protein